MGRIRANGNANGNGDDENGVATSKDITSDLLEWMSDIEDRLEALEEKAGEDEPDDDGDDSESSSTEPEDTQEREEEPATKEEEPEPERQPVELVEGEDGVMRPANWPSPHAPYRPWSLYSRD